MTRQFSIFAPLLACFLLASCVPGPEFRSLPPVSEDSCDANSRAGLIGAPATDLERVLILDPVRVIRPGQMVTMDYLPDRINFHVGADHRIDRISCG